MKLYNSLVLPVMDYGAAALVTATDLAQKEFGKLQRAALLKATGCMTKTILETLELVSNCIPMHFLLQLRQVEEMIRIYSKNEREQVLEDFKTSIEETAVRGKRTAFNFLLSTFNESKGKFLLKMYPKTSNIQRTVCF